MRRIKLNSPSSIALRSGRIALPSVIGATAATGLTVSDYSNQQVFQRVGTSKDILVSGTYTGPASIVQARAVAYGTPVSNGGGWANIVMSPTGGSYSGYLSVPQGGWYNIQVRDAVNPLVSASGSNKWGVGSIIAVCGQSNMYHLFTTPTSYPLGDPLCIDFDGTNWERLGNINDTFPVGTLYPSYVSYTAESSFISDGLVNFANRLRSASGYPIATIAFAQAGSNIASWLSGGNWDGLSARIASVGGDIEGMVWLQGESDASGTAAYYKTSLGTLHSQLHTATGRNSTSFKFGIVTLGQGTTGWTAEGNMGKIRQAQIEYINENAGAFYAGTVQDFSLSDSIHITGTGLAHVGNRYAFGLHRALTGNTNVAKGPVISSASRSGSTVTVTISHNGGTALADGIGGSGSSLLGFRVFDGGTPCTITATSISGATVSLTLSATPSGAVTLDYGMENAPFGSTVSPVNVLYDNQSIPGETLGLPLQPKPLIAVS